MSVDVPNEAIEAAFNGVLARYGDRDDMDYPQIRQYVAANLADALPVLHKAWEEESEIKTVNDATDPWSQGVPLEAKTHVPRHPVVRGTWDGQALRFTLPVDEWGIPELTDAHVRGIRELLRACRSERMYLVKEKGLKFVDD